MSSLLRFAILALAGITFCGPVAGQQYPAKPIRMIIGFPPGGGTDIIGRIVGHRLNDALGQQILPDNRGGASGQIAAELAAKAPPDGYTVMMAHIAAMSILPSLYPKLPYDPVKDFAPISLVAVSPNLVVIHPTLPVKNIKELIALARSRPGQIHYESSGIGTVQHLAGELFKLQANVDLLHVPYKGAGPAIIDLVAGHVQLGFDVVPVAGTQVKAGKLRALGVTSAKRSALFPDLPTVTESGVPGFDLSTWWGLVAPAAVNKDVIARLHGETVKVLRQKDVADRIADQGAEVAGSTPAEFAAFIRAEREKYARIVKEANIKLD
ncbi:MAG: Bug family tripartite tricarboxylate transporter substrate binding protein [Burkholderiales bacterium]